MSDKEPVTLLDLMLEFFANEAPGRTWDEVHVLADSGPSIYLGTSRAPEIEPE